MKAGKLTGLRIQIRKLEDSLANITAKLEGLEKRLSDNKKSANDLEESNSCPPNGEMNGKWYRPFKIPRTYQTGERTITTDVLEGNAAFSFINRPS
jgi:hypothetical protein